MKGDKWFIEKLESFKDDVDFRTEEVILDLTEKITEIMGREGINRTELAARLGVSKAFITKLLNGNPNLTLRTLVSISTALKYDVKINLLKRGFKILSQYSLGNEMENLEKEKYQNPVIPEAEIFDAIAA